MIENYAAKKKAKTVQLEFAESGNIAVLERRFDELTGVSVLKETQQASSKQIQDLIADCEKQMEPIQARIADLKALLPDVEKKEKERDGLAAKNAKKRK